jgi:outer membrane receptor protein involved in Fe transport
MLALPVLAFAQEGQPGVPAANAPQPVTPQDPAATAVPEPTPLATPSTLAPESVPPAPAAGAESTLAPSSDASSIKGRDVEEIVVTGSRIRRLDLTTAAPVTVIGKEQIQASGKVSIGDFLQTLPEQGNAINTGVNNGGDGATRVSLRSLGPQRTLVLLNGRRMMAGGVGADSSPDLNSIPTAIIDHIEVLKDGASAIYGSDAIGGVVNIITRKKWNGSEANVYLGATGHGDGQTVDATVTTGVSGEKGSILFSAGYGNQDKIMAGDRDFAKYQYFYDATGLNNAAGVLGQYAAGSSRAPGGRVGASGSGNAAWNALLADTKPPAGSALIHDNSIAPNAACLAAGGSEDDCRWRIMNTSNTEGLGGDLYNFAPANYLITPQQRFSSWASGDLKLGDYTRAFFEASYVNRRSKQQLAPEPLIVGAGGLTDAGGNLVRISKDNLYNPFGKDFTSASRRLVEFGPRTHDEDIGAMRFVAGLDGTLSNKFGPLEGWSWDASLNYGRTYATFAIGGSLQTSRVADALGPSMMIGGKPACVRVAGDPSTQISGCVPLDLFHGAGSITSDQVAPLIFTGTSSGLNDLLGAQLNTSGELFRLFSPRAVSLAVGYEFRRVGGAFINDPLTAKFDSSNGGAYDTAGNYRVNEGYAELSIPIVSGKPLVEDLEASFAARVFNYNNFGSDWTYKGGLRWTPVRDITLRGTFSSAFRAPSISDLFAGQFDSFPNVSDPCASPTDPAIIARCGDAANNGDDSTQLKSRLGGNSTLKPETAKIFTAGVVIQPRMVKNLSITLDYYHVAIDNSISINGIGESTILAGCYTSGDQPSYCQYIQRDPISNQINQISNLIQNVGQENEAGLDIALRYNIPTPSAGRFVLTFDGTWLQYHDQILADGTVVHGKNTFDLQYTTGQGGTNPAFKFNAGVLWGLKGFGAGLTTKFISGFHECADETGNFAGGGLCYADSTYQRKVDPYNSWDAFVSYQVKSDYGKTNFAVGVNNLFNADPVKIYNGFASATDQYSYDQIGRFFYVRMGHSI